MLNSIPFQFKYKTRFVQKEQKQQQQYQHINYGRNTRNDITFEKNKIAHENLARELIHLNSETLLCGSHFSKRVSGHMTRSTIWTDTFWSYIEDTLPLVTCHINGFCHITGRHITRFHLTTA